MTWVDGRTEVLTRLGWRSISSVDCEDILTIDPDTLEASFNKVKVTQKKAKDFYRFKTDRINLTLACDTDVAIYKDNKLTRMDIKDIIEDTKHIHKIYTSFSINKYYPNTINELELGLILRMRGRDGLLYIAKEDQVDRLDTLLEGILHTKENIKSNLFKYNIKYKPTNILVPSSEDSITLKDSMRYWKTGNRYITRKGIEAFKDEGLADLYQLYSTLTGNRSYINRRLTSYIDYNTKVDTEEKAYQVSSVSDIAVSLTPASRYYKNKSIPYVSKAKDRYQYKVKDKFIVYRSYGRIFIG